MKKYINLNSVLSDEQNKVIFTAKYETESINYEYSIDEYLSSLQMIGAIEDYDLEGEIVLIDVPDIEHFQGEGETLYEYKTETRNCFDFIQETLSEYRQQAFSKCNYLHESEKEKKEVIFEAFGCSSDRDSDCVSIDVKKNSEGDLHFKLTAKFPAVMTPNHTKVFINDIDLQVNQTVIEGVYVA